MESCAKHAGKMWKERFEEDYPYITYFRPTPDSGKLSVNPCRGEIYGVYPKTCENCTHCWEAGHGAYRGRVQNFLTPGEGLRP